MSPEESSGKVSMFLAACAFVFAIAAGVAFLHVYWTGYQTPLMGWTFGLSLALFAVAFVLWGHGTSIRKEASEQRDLPGSSEEDLQSVREEFYPANQTARRRNFLFVMGTAVVAFFGAIFVSLLRSFAGPPDQSLFGTIWKQGDRLLTSDGQPVSNDALMPGSTTVVFPEGQVGSVHAQTVLIRVDPEKLQLPADRSGWAPGGYVAYSRVCTHAGCPVAQYEAKANLLLCPCHQSTFSVLEGGRPTGGPAARALAQLPLYAGEDGFLHAAGDFDKPPGAGFWSYP
jgi:ubiquinol-cytochrome c reductase iron-sulfur subunit